MIFRLFRMLKLEFEKSPLKEYKTNSELKELITNSEIVFGSEVISKDTLCLIVRDVLIRKYGDIQVVKNSILNHRLRFFVINLPQKNKRYIISAIENNAKREIITINGNNENKSNESFSKFIFLVLTDENLNTLSHCLVLTKQFDESLMIFEKEVTEIKF